MDANCVDIETYVKLALRGARVEPEGDEWFAEIPGFTGVWAAGTNPEVALNQLESVLRVWLQLKLDQGDKDIPELERTKLSASRP